MYNFFILFWLAFLALFLVLLARQGIQNGCPNWSGEHENSVLAGVIAESHKKEWFLSLFGCFFGLCSIDVLVVFDVGFEAIRSILAKRWYQNNTGKPMVLHQKQRCRKIDNTKKKTKKTIKKRFKNMSWKKTWKSHLSGSLFPWFWTPKTREMRPRTSKKQAWKMSKKRA